MEKVALVLCSSEYSGWKTGGLLLKRVRKALDFKTKRKSFDSMLSSVPTEEFAGIYLARIPFHPAEIEELGQRRLEILKKSARSCIENEGISLCIKPASLGEAFALSGCVPYHFAGIHLHKALLMHMLHLIFTARGVQLKNLEVSIVCIEFDPELEGLMKNISASVRYLTVVCSHREQAERIAEEIYDETGLSVRVSSDTDRGVRGADVIINMSDNAVTTSMLKPRQGGIVINYRPHDCSSLAGEYVLINGMDIAFPPSVQAKLGTGVNDFYTRMELAEILLSQKAGVIHNIIQGTCSPEMLQAICDEFEKNGFRILCFKGRRNDIKINEIRLPSPLPEKEEKSGRNRTGRHFLTTNYQ